MVSQALVQKINCTFFEAKAVSNETNLIKVTLTSLKMSIKAWFPLWDFKLCYLCLSDLSVVQGLCILMDSTTIVAIEEDVEP